MRRPSTGDGTHQGFELFQPPGGTPRSLPGPPRLASWDRTGAPSQRRLAASLAEVDRVLAARPLPPSPWALELDVAVPPGGDLEEAGDLDNYLFPLLQTRALRGGPLVSAHARKSLRAGPSTLRLGTAVAAPAPSEEPVVARTACSATSLAWKEAVRDQVARATSGPPVPPGFLELDVAFLVGPRRSWANLWKAAIDALGPVLGVASPSRPFHPRDGRIVRLGLHCAVRAALGHQVELGYWWRVAA